MRRVVFADTAVVLSKRDIEHPMQAVLDTSMTACCVGKRRCGGDALAANVEGALLGKRAVDVPLSLDHADASEFWPVCLKAFAKVS